MRVRVRRALGTIWTHLGGHRGVLQASEGDLEQNTAAPETWGGYFLDKRGWEQARGCSTATHPTAPLGTTGTSETLSVTAVPGGQLTLECPVGAVPPPYIEWHREGSPLRVGVPGGLRGWVPPISAPLCYLWAQPLTGDARGLSGGCPQGDPGRGTVPEDPGRGGSRRGGVRLQGWHRNGGQQAELPGGNSR